MKTNYTKLLHAHMHAHTHTHTHTHAEKIFTGRKQKTYTYIAIEN